MRTTNLSQGPGEVYSDLEDDEPDPEGLFGPECDDAEMLFGPEPGE